MNEQAAIRPLEAGTDLGRYSLRKRLKRRGAIEIWLARCSGAAGFTKPVILDVFRPELASGPGLEEQFVHQARLASTFNHPNIVQILDLGQRDGRTFIATEHVPGRTLRHLESTLLRQRKVPPPWLVFRAALAICNALEYAHGARDETGRPLGIVHRNLRPDNAAMSFNGVTKLFGFGIAASTGPNQVESDSRLGWQAYLSPEQIETSGRSLDPRSDIYSLGVTLYELLTGVRPFRAEDEHALRAKILTVPPKPPSAMASWVSSSMDDLIMRAMDKDPDQRHQSVAEFRAEVEAYLATLTAYPTQRLVAEYLRKLYGIDGADDSYHAPQVPIEDSPKAESPGGPIAEAVDDPDMLVELAGCQDNVQILLSPDAPLETADDTGADAFSGRVGGIDLFDFLQMMLAARRQARLELFSLSSESAMLWVSEGDIVHATCGTSQGNEAVFRCLAFEGGNFSVLPWQEPLEKTIDARGDYLLLEAARKIDEGNQAQADVSDSGSWDLSSLDLGPKAEEDRGKVSDSGSWDLSALDLGSSADRSALDVGARGPAAQAQVGPEQEQERAALMSAVTALEQALGTGFEVGCRADGAELELDFRSCPLGGLVQGQAEAPGEARLCVQFHESLADLVGTLIGRRCEVVPGEGACRFRLIPR